MTEVSLFSILSQHVPRVMSFAWLMFKTVPQLYLNNTYCSKLFLVILYFDILSFGDESFAQRRGENHVTSSLEDMSNPPVSATWNAKCRENVPIPNSWKLAKSTIQWTTQPPTPPNILQVKSENKYSLKFMGLHTFIEILRQVNCNYLTTIVPDLLIFLWIFCLCLRTQENKENTFFECC